MRLVTVLCVVVLAITLLGHNAIVHGQSYGGMAFGPIAPALSNCPAGITGMASLCAVGSGTSYTLYVSYNAGAYAPLIGASNGVASFNGRTGNVLLNKADVTGTGLAVSVSVGPPAATTTVTAPSVTATLQ